MAQARHAKIHTKDTILEAHLRNRVLLWFSCPQTSIRKWHWVA